MLNKEDMNNMKPLILSTPDSFQGHLVLIEKKNNKNGFLLLSLLNPPLYLKRPRRVMTE